nr:translation initiation factor IF-2-like [Equus asinus]
MKEEMEGERKPQPALSPRSLEGKGAQPTGLTQPEVRFSSRSAFLSPCSGGGDRRACRSAARGTSPCITEAVFGWRFPFPSFGSIPSFPLFLPLTPEGFSVPRVSPERRPEAPRPEAAPPPASPGPAGGSAPPALAGVGAAVPARSGSSAAAASSDRPRAFQTPDAQVAQTVRISADRPGRPSLLKFPGDSVKSGLRNTSLDRDTGLKIQTHLERKRSRPATDAAPGCLLV